MKYIDYIGSLFLTLFVTIVVVFVGTIGLVSTLLGINIDATDDKGKKKANILFGIAFVLTVAVFIYLAISLTNQYYKQQAEEEDIQKEMKGK